MKKTDYNIGVDIGTNSVGYAVTNADGALLKFKSKNMWGVRLFDEGVTAKQRRLYRGQRRRYVRKKQRIIWLQELVASDIDKVDNLFFMKMRQSNLINDDKTVQSFKETFNDIVPEKKGYSEKYPTIYHLREHLIESKEKEDIRLVYLAMHHIIKYRGNFLYEGQSIEANSTMDNAIRDVVEILAEMYEFDIQDEEKIIENISKILKNKSLNKIDSKKELVNIFNPSKEDKSFYTELSALVVGGKANINKMFGLESDIDLKIELSEEDAFDKVAEVLDDRQLELFELLQKVYSAKVLSDIIGKESNISAAMVSKYNKHKADLQDLKKVYRKYFTKQDYEEMFASNRDGKNKGVVGKYEKYRLSIKDTQSSSKSGNDSYSALKKYLLTKLTSIDEKDELVEKIKSDIENDNFLLKLNTTENAAIPYQLHKWELEKIIDNQSKYYLSLKENKEKILSIIEYKIPYYVGPVGKVDTKFNWAKRKSDGKIYPWTFNDVVDTDNAAEDFIKRMRNYCTYLPTEEVIPKDSLLYSEYEVRQEIKQIRIDDRFLSVEEQNDLYEEVFKNNKTVSEGTLKKWLKNRGIVPQSIRGYQKDKQFASSLKSYIDMKNIFGSVTGQNKEMIEDIILWVTLFNEKDIIKRKIKNVYPSVTDSQIKKILNLKYSGWSRFSKKLLVGLKTKDKYGNEKSIMDYLRSTKKNFMQIINDDKLGFKDLIEEENSFSNDNMNFDAIQKLATSPANKKAIWQTVLVIEEIEKIMKCPPKNIFVEFARNESDKRRISSRYNQLFKIYSEHQENLNVFDELKKYDKDKKALDKKKLYLYFLQNGKCLYSGRPLDINNLDKYEVDHIIPRSYIKDDSIENLALVYKEENQRKTDNMLLDRKIINSQRMAWINLKKCGLMKNKKFANLTRESFDENELKGFVDRQLVETRQITKHVVNILKSHYDASTAVVAIRANLSSELREKYCLYKSREVNDYHHAFDAYLASFMGIYVQKCYPNLNDEFEYGKYRKYIKSVKKTRNSFGYLLDNIEQIKVLEDTGEVIWDGVGNIQKLIKAYNYKDCFISRKVEEQSGEFYDQNLSKKPEKDDSKLIPMSKDKPVKNYGGYGGTNQAYYSVIRYTNTKKKKNNIEYKLVGIPVYIARLEKTKSEAKIKYLEAEGYTNVEIVKDKIKKYQKVAYEGNIYYLVSSSEVVNAKPLLLSKKDYQTAAVIEKNNRLENILRDKPIFTSEEELEECVDTLIEDILEKINNNCPCYNNLSLRIMNKLPEIKKLSLTEKQEFAVQIMRIMQPKTNAYLSRFKIDTLKDRQDRMSGKNLSIDRIEFIDTSVTGMYEHRYSLKIK